MDNEALINAKNRLRITYCIFFLGTPLAVIMGIAGLFYGVEEFKSLWGGAGAILIGLGIVLGLLAAKAKEELDPEGYSDLNVKPIKDKYLPKQRFMADVGIIYSLVGTLMSAIVAFAGLV